MELFKLFGTIAIHNDEANQAIDDTVGKAKTSESSLSSTFKKVGTAVAAAFSAQKIIDFGVQSVNTLQGFEDSMLKVQSLSGATADQYQQLSDAALHYGSTTAWTSQNVADAMGYMALAGFDTNEILSATPGVLSLASASGEDLATVSDILTDAMTGFGDSASDATRYADVLATTQAKSNTTVGMLGEAFTYVSSLAGTYSYSLEDVSTALGVMANAGVKGSMAGTSLSSVITRLGTNTSGARDAIEALGVQFYNTDGTARPLGDVIVDLCDATANMTTEQKASLASTVAGAEAQKGLLAILNQGSSAYTDLNQKLKESSGNADEMAGTLESGLGGAIRSLSSAWEGFKIKLAQKFEVPLSDLIHKFANFITDSAIPALDNFVSAITPVVTALGNFGEAITSAWEDFKQIISNALDTISSTIQNIWNAIVAFLTPILQGIADTFTSIWNNILTAVQTATNTISNVLQTVWNAIVGFLTPILQGIRDTFTNSWNAIQNTVKTVVTAIQTFLQTTWNTITSLIRTAMNTIHNVIQTVWNTIKSVVQSVLNTIQSIVSSVWNTVKGVTTSVWNGISSAVSNAINTVKNVISGGLNAAHNTVSNIFNSIRNTISNIMNGAANVVSGAINRIKGFFNFSWSLPHLAMPHPYISGSFSLNPPSVPSFGINWYAKGGILTEPTLFSLNPKTGRASVGGEAGDEAVAPIDTLLTYIRTAVGEQNGDLAGKLDALIELLQQYFSTMLDNMQRGIVLDSGVLVGELAPAMDEALGEIYYRKGRE